MPHYDANANDDANAPHANDANEEEEEEEEEETKPNNITMINSSSNPNLTLSAMVAHLNVGPMPLRPALLRRLRPLPMATDAYRRFSCRMLMYWLRKVVTRLPSRRAAVDEWLRGALRAYAVCVPSTPTITAEELGLHETAMALALLAPALGQAADWRPCACVRCVYTELMATMRLGIRPSSLLPRAAALFGPSPATASLLFGPVSLTLPTTSRVRVLPSGWWCTVRRVLVDELWSFDTDAPKRRRTPNNNTNRSKRVGNSSSHHHDGGPKKKQQQPKKRRQQTAAAVVVADEEEEEEVVASDDEAEDELVFEYATLTMMDDNGAHHHHHHGADEGEEDGLLLQLEGVDLYITEEDLLDTVVMCSGSTITTTAVAPPSSAAFAAAAVVGNDDDDEDDDEEAAVGEEANHAEEDDDELHRYDNAHWARETAAAMLYGGWSRHVR